jgi:hypothetical protein
VWYDAVPAHPREERVKVTVSSIVIVASLAVGCADEEPVRLDPQVSRADLGQKQSYHVTRSTPVVKAWRKLRAGDRLNRLNELAADPHWVENALFRRIDSLGGYLPPSVQIQEGYTVFCIYPYLREDDSQPSVYQGIYIKLAGWFSIDSVRNAILSGDSATFLHGYFLFGDGIAQSS